MLNCDSRVNVTTFMACFLSSLFNYLIAPFILLHHVLYFALLNVYVLAPVIAELF